MAVQRKEELMHMERKEVEKEKLQNQVQSLVHDNLKLQVRKIGCTLQCAYIYDTYIFYVRYMWPASIDI